LTTSITDKNDLTKSLKVEIIIPTLNEEANIASLLKEIKDQKIPVKISTLVIDGSSSDKTVEICLRENITVIQQRRRGKGNAMREAVEHSKADIIVFIDGDGTYLINELGKILEPLLTDKADMVVGSRILGEKERGSISTLNKLGNSIFNRIINSAMKSKITDSLSGYRALRKETFKDLILFSNNFEIEVEMTVEALAKGYRVIEVPISYKKRKNSVTHLSPVTDGTKIGRTLLFILMNVDPLKLFGRISLWFFIAGLFPGIFVFYEKITFGEIESMPSVVFAALLFMSSGLSLVIGLLAELVVTSRRRIEYLLKK